MSLQNILKFTDYEIKSKDFIDRLNAKLSIKEEASNYFKQTLKFLMNKTVYNKENRKKSTIIPNTDESEKLIKKKEYENADKLKQSLINRVKQKINLKTTLSNFHRDFEPYNPMSELKDKIRDLTNRVDSLSEKNEEIELILKQLLSKL